MRVALALIQKVRLMFENRDAICQSSLEGFHSHRVQASRALVSMLRMGEVCLSGGKFKILISPPFSYLVAERTREQD
jgi:hypothetical protein